MLSRDLPVKKSEASSAAAPEAANVFFLDGQLLGTRNLMKHLLSPLGGSWYLLTTCNCTYNCASNHIKALRGSHKWVIGTVMTGS